MRAARTSPHFFRTIGAIATIATVTSLGFLGASASASAEPVPAPTSTSTATPAPAASSTSAPDPTASPTAIPTPAPPTPTPADTEAPASGASPTNAVTPSAPDPVPGQQVFQAATSPAPATISGHVSLGTAGTPATAGEVLVYYAIGVEDYSPQQMTTSVPTDASGNYTISVSTDPIIVGAFGTWALYFKYVGSGGYASSYLADPYPNYAAATVSVTSGQTTVANKTLPLPASITGTVSLGTTATTAPAGSVEVSYIESVGETLDTDLESAPVAVDAQGHYTLPNLPPAHFRLHFTYTGTGRYQSKWYTVGDVTSTSTVLGLSNTDSTVVAFPAGVDLPVNFTLPPTRSISGHVNLGTAATSAGANQIAISYYYYPSDESGADTLVSTSATTDASGNFTLGGLVDGWYGLSFAAVGTSNYLPYATSEFEVTSTPVAAITATLTLLVSVTGHVNLDNNTNTGSNAAPANGVMVTLLTATGTIAWGYTGVPVAVDSSGNFSFPAIPAGYNYSLEFSYNAAGQDCSPNLLASGCDYNTVYLGGAATEDGAQYFDPTANYVVPSVTMQFANEVAGTVTSSAGAPVVGVSVDAVYYNPDGQTYTLRAVLTDAAGHYLIRGLPDGAFDVRVVDNSRGYQTSAVQHFVFSAKGLDSGVNFVVEPSNSISGTVTSDSAQALSGVTVTLGLYDPNTQQFSTAATTTTATDGTYSFSGLADGQYAVGFVGASSYAEQTFDDEGLYFQPDLITLDDGTVASGVNAALHLASTISGTVSAPGGSAADFANGDVTAEVAVLDGPTQTWVETGDYYPVTASGGAETYSIPNLAPDNYKILFDYVGPTFNGKLLSPIISVAAGSTIVYNATILNQAVPQPRGSFDTASGVAGAIQISGWSLDLSTPASTYVWVNVDGSGGPLLANGSLPWIDTLYPGEGANHGFAETIGATPGTHTVCVYGSDSLSLGCKTVSVPFTIQGSLDSATAVLGGIQISGWSVNLPTAAPTYVWVNVDGVGGPMLANQPYAWVGILYPTEGPDHGFSGTVATSPGTHTICVYGAYPFPLGCKTVTVPQNAQGSFDAATGVPGGIQVSGWSLDLLTTASTYVWVNVDGRGGPMLANESLPWINALFPGEGTDHGFAGTVTASPGLHRVCISGTDAISLGCRSVVVPQNAQGSFDSASGVVGGIQISGWSLDLSTTASTYVWVNVDGSGGPVLANGSLPWINALFPGEGVNHGFAETVGASPGNHTVCVFGTNSLALGCKTVTVPISAHGSFDSAAGVPGGIAISGWSLDLSTTASTYIWVNVDGSGGPMLANVSLPWINALYPGEGVNHGFAGTVSASPGVHTVCVYGTSPLVLGCKTVTVPVG